MHNHHNESWQPHPSSKDTIICGRWGLSVPEQEDRLLEKSFPQSRQAPQQRERDWDGAEGSES